MNLTKLFDMQRVLDQRILDKHPELKGQDNLEWKVLALQVELGECANEWRGFKKWSNDQEPRIAWKQPSYRGGYIERNLVLEEYVDCLHFVLSIGIELKLENTQYMVDDEHLTNSIEQDFLNNMGSLKHVYDSHILKFDISDIQEYYRDLLFHFFRLGDRLGFTWEQIEQAYFEKNKINHTRQEQGY
ncbi:dUTP diphosphatase [Priestia megaterium]|uniref:dUTP diphosphatase n=1 Tax=Priestia megaterium TaxID=1404 RepID=UPI001E425408|nr:dUTP diphosphatase [Priestia megaterium]MCE4092839.1 dUTP diphosphatase [Priestia megaterium]